MPDERPVDGPSVINALPAAESAWFDGAHSKMVKHPQFVIAIFVYKARAIPNRAPPFS